MGWMTLEDLKQKYGTEGVRVIASLMNDKVEGGADLDTSDIQLMKDILVDVGEVLTEEVT